MLPTGTKRRYSDTYGVKERRSVFVLILLSFLIEAKVFGYNEKQSTWPIEWWKIMSKARYIRYKSGVTSLSVLRTVLLIMTDRPTDRPANRPNDSKTTNNRILKIVVKQKVRNIMQNSTIYNNTWNWKLFSSGPIVHAMTEILRKKKLFDLDETQFCYEFVKI